MKSWKKLRRGGTLEDVEGGWKLGGG